MEDSIFKDGKYLTGLLVGFILAIIVTIGVNRYQEKSFFEGENVVQKENEEIDAFQEELKEQIKNNVEEIQKGGIATKKEMTPETPHSPELQRLDLILREAGRMIERMERDIAKVNETQTANISQ